MAFGSRRGGDLLRMWCWLDITGSDVSLVPRIGEKFPGKSMVFCDMKPLSSGG
tara:strand:+ start:381 stop:539 length:159 start_codon:yes stop_codon:yes gene_type:complete